MFKRKGLIAIVAVFALVAAACGSSDGGSKESAGEIGLVFDIGMLLRTRLLRS